MAAAGAQVEFTRAGRGVLFAAMVGTMCGASPLPFNVLPMVIGPVHAELGWSFLQINLGITLFGIVASLLAPVYGGLADKYGVRPVALLSLLGFGLAFATFALMPPTLLGWYAGWALIGLIGIGSTPVTWSRAVSMWFVRHRGLALGIMLVGTSLAGLTVPRLANAAITIGGWRMAFPALALLPLFVALPVGLLLFREPRAEERPPELTDSAGNLSGIDVPTALRGYRFWVLWLSIALVSLAYGGIFINMVQIVGLHGFGAAEGAAVMGVMALGILSGRVIVGLLLDRFWAPAVLMPALLLPAIACVLLMGSASGFSRLVVAAALLGFAAGAESDLIAYSVGRYFGMAHYGKLYGLLYMPFGLGSAISPAIYGAVRDRTGSYDAMLMVAVFMFAAGGALLLTLGRYPRFGLALAEA